MKAIGPGKILSSLRYSSANFTVGSGLITQGRSQSLTPGWAR